MDPITLAALATSLAQWLQIRKTRRTDESHKTIEDYKDWLRRGEHADLASGLEQNHELLKSITQLIDDRSLDTINSQEQLQQTIEQRLTLIVGGVVGQIHGPVTFNLQTPPSPAMPATTDKFATPLAAPMLASFAPGAAPKQIPSPPGDFVGREDEIREILEHLNDRGVTISGVQGMGGIGKTALAYVLAQRLKPKFDAHFYLDLKGTSEKPLTPSDAQAHVLLGYQPESKPPDDPAQLAGLYQSLLSERPALLMMDNAADKAQVEPLIPPAGCVLLVTSRQHFTLPGWFAKDLNTLPPDKARELLVSIAPRIAATGDADQQQLDEITRLCGYLPLAVRLAGGALAVRVDVSLERYIKRLSDERARLDQLDEVRAAILASEALLDASTRRLWRLLAVFGGDFDKPAAAAVWELDDNAADKAIGTLLQFSLLEWSNETKRYRLHDLVRLAARERLDEEGAARYAAELRFATHYKDVLAKADDMYMAGGEQVVAGLALYDLETHNTQAAFDCCAARSAKDDDAARLCSAIPDAGDYCFSLRQHPRNTIAQREKALAAARRLKDRAAEGRHLGMLGYAHDDIAEYRRAIEFYEQQLEITREIGDRRGEGIALGNLGITYKNLGEPRRAIEFYEQVLEVMRDIGDRGLEGATLGNLGTAHAALGEPRRAIEFYEQRLEIAREMGDRRGEGNALGNVASAYADLGETRRAIEFFEQHLLIAREIGDRRGEGAALGNLGLTYAALGEPRRAIEFCEQQLEITREIGDRRGEGQALGNLGNAYAALGESRRAIEFYEQQLEITREIGDRRGEANASWNLGAELAKAGEMARAVELMQVLVDYEREIGHPNAEKDAAHVANLRRQLDSK